MDSFEYDEERLLWKPGRRSFLFMFGAATAALITDPALIAQAPKFAYRITGIGIRGEHQVELIDPTSQFGQILTKYPNSILPWYRRIKDANGNSIGMLGERKFFRNLTGIEKVRT